MSDVYTLANANKTPQTRKTSKEQVKNRAGGYVFEVSLEQRLKRFMVLGTDSNQFYVSKKDLFFDNYDVVKEAAESAHDTLLAVILDVSLNGLSKKQNALIFSYAVACSTDNVDNNKKALAEFNKIIRTGTHLFMFMKYVKQFRGMGRALKNTIANWYLDKDTDKLAYQIVKYRNREGWTHRDVLRQVHPKADGEMNDLLAYAADKGEARNSIVVGFERAKIADADDLKHLIANHGLTWEMVPTDKLNDPKVLAALFKNMPIGALVRNLNRFANAGLTPQMGGLTKDIVKRLTDQKAISKSRIHPMQILFAKKTYESGGGWRSSNSWQVNTAIVAALEDAFYLAFDNVEPTGKRTMIGLDVSGSMTSPIMGTEITSAEAVAAMSLVIAKTEPEYYIHGFTAGNSRRWGYGHGYMENAVKGFVDLKITHKDSLASAMRKAQDNNFGATDASVAMRYAMDNGIEVDTFIIMTDNETYAGSIHPFQALKEYRKKMGINAKLVVMATYPSAFTIADPSDGGMLDVVGFSPDVPSLIANFSKE